MKHYALLAGLVGALALGTLPSFAANHGAKEHAKEALEACQKEHAGASQDAIKECVKGKMKADYGKKKQ